MVDSVDFGAPGQDAHGKQHRSDVDSFLRPVLESGFLLLAIRFAEPILFEPGFYAQLDFHPFWIVILLTAMHYGLFGGVAAAGLACFLMDWPARPLGTDITQHYIELAIQPLYWLVVAFCIGSYRTLQIREARRVQGALDASREVSAELAREIDRMDAALAHAELGFVTQGADAAGPAPFAGPLLGLFRSTGTPDDLIAAFAEAAETATDLPAALILDDGTGAWMRVAEAGDTALPDDGLGRLIEKAREAGGATVVSRQSIGAGEAGHLTLATVRAGGEEPSGLVVLAAEDEDQATAARPLAELMSIAAASALASDVSAEHRTAGNVRVLPTGSI